MDCNVEQTVVQGVTEGNVKKKKYVNVVGAFGCLLGLLSLWLPFYGNDVNISLFEASNLDGDGKVFLFFLVPLVLALILFLLRLTILPMLIGTAGNAIIALVVYFINDRGLEGTYLSGYYCFLAGGVIVILSLFLNRPLIRMLKKETSL